MSRPDTYERLNISEARVEQLEEVLRRVSNRAPLHPARGTFYMVPASDFLAMRAALGEAKEEE